jgi:2-(1,2-epoxy-1,2-dihydrophenyl)acetyl-CoA isomerase
MGETDGEASAATGDLRVERDGGLVTFTFDRPERKNAVNAAIWNALDAALHDVENDPDVRALVVTGAGGNFSSGADLSGEGGGGGLTGRGVQPIVNEMRTVGRIISRLRHLPKPTIAAVDGVAVGVSLGIALSCDLVLATERARFMEVFVKRGLALDGGTSWSLPRLVGLRRAKQMAFFGDTVDGPTALEWGLVNELVAPEALAETAAEWGQRLATGPTVAISLIKTMMDEGMESSFDAALEGEARAQHIVYGTKDIREGMLAFAERREPRFTGE